MPESALWAVDEHGIVLNLSTWRCGWTRVEAKGSRIGFFKRVSAASWCIWAVGCDHQAYLMVHSSDVKIRVQEVVYENERWFPGGFSSSHLRRQDPYHYSNYTGALPVNKEFLRLPSSRWTWEDDWKIQETIKGEITASGGWQYANDFDREFSSERRYNSFVRRLKWIRHRRFATLDRWLLIPLEHDDPTRDPLVELSCGGEMLPHQPDGFLAVWAVTLEGRLLYRTSVYRQCPEGKKWLPITVPNEEFVICISVGPLANVWISTDQGNIYVREGVSRLNPLGAGWLEVPSPDPAENEGVVQLGVGVRSVWAVGHKGRYWFRRGVNAFEPGRISGTQWTNMVGRVRMISVGPNDQVWAIDQLTFRLLHRTGVTHDAPSGKVWCPIELPVVVTRPGRLSCSISSDSGGGQSIELDDPAEKPPGKPLSSQKEGDGTSTKVENNIDSPYEDIGMDDVFTSDAVQQVSIEKSTESNPTASEYCSSSWPGASIVRSGSPVSRTTQGSKTDRFLNHSQSTTTNTVVASLETTVEEDDNEDEVGVERLALTTLRWVTPSALYLEKSLPRLWSRNQSVTASPLSVPAVAVSEAGRSGSSSDVKSSVGGDSPGPQRIIRNRLTDTRQASLLSSWRRCLMARLSARDFVEYQNPSFVGYTPALEHGSWTKSCQCQVLEGGLNSGDKGRWRESTLTLEQWRDGHEVKAILMVEYSVKKKPVCEALDSEWITCVGKLIPTVGDSASGPLRPSFAVYTTPFTISQLSALALARAAAGAPSIVNTAANEQSKSEVVTDSDVEVAETHATSDSQSESDRSSSEPIESTVDETSDAEKIAPTVTASTQIEVPSSESPRDACRWILRMNTEAEVEDWLLTLSVLCCEQRCLLAPRTAPSTPGQKRAVAQPRAWVLSETAEPFTAELPLEEKGVPPEQLYWRQMGGHLRQVESGYAGAVTWAVGHNGVAYAYTGGWGGGFLTGLASSFTGIHTQKDSRELYTFEYQRWRLLRGFTDKGYLFDPYLWSDESGTVQRTREQVRLLSRHWSWSEDWRVDHGRTEGCDEEGWQYSKDFNTGKYEKEQRWNTNVRRRKWVREYRVTTTGPWTEIAPVRLRDVSIQPAPMSSELTQAREIHLWAVSTNGDLLRRRGVTHDKPQGVYWVHVAAEQDFLSVSVSPLLHVWAVGVDGSAWLRLGVHVDDEGVSWAHVGPAPENCPLIQISAGHCTVWAVDARGRLWSRKGVRPVVPEGTEWVMVTNGGVRAVSCGPGTKVWAVFTVSGCVAERRRVCEEIPNGEEWCSALRGFCVYASVRGAPAPPQTMCLSGDSGS